VGRNDTIVRVGEAMGLTSNISKCELICHPDTLIMDQKLASFIRISVTNCTLLGAPLFSGSVLDDVWSQRCLYLSIAIGRLKLIGYQDALILLR
jgi:hypothetical protein